MLIYLLCSHAEGYLCYFEFAYSSTQQSKDTKQDIYLKDVILALSWERENSKIKCFKFLRFFFHIWLNLFIGISEEECDKLEEEEKAEEEEEDKKRRKNVLLDLQYRLDEVQYPRRNEYKTWINK